jgi:acetyl-CoA acetyltransferase
VHIAQNKGDPVSVDRDEHPRETNLETLAQLKDVVRHDGAVTAGNASGVNDGACALLLASEPAAVRHGRTPRACSAWPRPAWPRASWASGRRRPRARCWR